MELKRYKLGEILELQRGYDLPSSQQKAGNVLVAGSNGIIGYHNEIRGNHPCITVGRSGSVGKVHYYEQPTWAHNTALFVKDFKGNNPQYLYYFLKNLHLDEMFVKGSSVVPSLDRKVVHSLVVPFHKEVVCQKRIALVLSNIDRKIELNRAINQNLEAVIADVMDYKFLSNAETLPKRFIGDIASIKAGGDCPQEWSKYKTKDCQIPIYSNGTDNEGLYGYTKEPTILKRGITVAARGTIGYCTMRNGGYVPIIRLLAVTPNDIGGDVYLHQIFNRIKFRNDGSIQQQLTVPSLASIEIPYPNASTLKAFANITYPLIEKIKQNKIQIEELTKQRDELLPLLMNGQVSVNSDLSDD
jgi:type I restriction enzyme S subunit